jgi:hypothetical protein
VKSLYKLSTGLWETKGEEFDSDEEAWESLRTILPHKFATLLKWTVIKVPVVNLKRYVENHNSKYTTQTTEETAGDCHKYIPVLNGITDDPYDIK